MTNQELNTSKHDRYKSASFRAFNARMGDRYDTLYWLRVFRAPDWDRAVADVLQPYLVSGRILDVGCASGRLLHALAKRGAPHLYGVDLAPRMIEVAQEKLAPLDVRCELCSADVEEALPWADSFFDAAVLSGVIHHFFRPADALAQIHRVLQPGGRLVIVEPGFPFGIRHALNAYLRLFPHDGDCRFYNPNQLARLVTSSGFESIGEPQYPGRFSYMVVFARRTRKES